MGLGGTHKGLRKGPWTREEDSLLCEYVTSFGDCSWNSVARLAGLNRSGKSCRLRWVNYLKPGLKKGKLTPEEESIIFELHAVLGNKWSTIATYLPGRTDNEIKNFWRTNLKNKDQKPFSKKSEKRRPQGLNQIKQVQKGEKQLQEGNMKTRTETEQTEAQEKKQEFAFMSPSIEEQEITSLWSDMMGYEGILVSLWNLDEQPQGHHADDLNQFSNYAMLNPATFGGDPSKLVAQINQDKTFGLDEVFNNLCYEKYVFG